jgi:hypothetical protein
MNTSRADALPQTAPIDSHRFFVGLGFYCMLLTAIGFGPSFYDYFTDGYYIPPLMHVHAAIMFTWLVLFTNQANLAARAKLLQGRRIPVFGPGSEPDASGPAQLTPCPLRRIVTVQPRA